MRSVRFLKSTEKNCFDFDCKYYILVFQNKQKIKRKLLHKTMILIEYVLVYQLQSGGLSKVKGLNAF